MQSFATKAKKAITKVAALGTGVAMMGATLTGALALSTRLSDYPSAFKDALVVVGTAASGADDTAAADIAGDIPTTSKVTAISGDTYQIEKGGNKWNINQDVTGIDNSITDTELDLLADQTFKDDEGTNTGDSDYTQTLWFTSNATQVLFETDTSGNRENDPAGTYLKFQSAENKWAWNYTIKFTGSKIKVKDAADLENNVLSILGRDWTITDTSMSNTSYGAVDKLTLLAGDVLSTILQGSTVGGVTVVDVDEAETKCIVEYAGKTYIIDKGQTKTMDDGTIVGITDVTAVHESGAGQDMCELAIGAHKLVLEDGKKVSVNNEDVDNSLVFISGNETADVAGFKQLIVSYQPEDNTWLMAGESLEDPVFGAFKIVFNQLVEKDKEEIKIDPIGDKIKVKWKNKDGDIFDDYICYLNGTGTARQFHYGYSDNKQMAVFDGQTITNNTVGTSGTYVTPKGMKGTRFLMTFSGISHIAEITDIDSANNKTSIKLLDSGEVYKDLEYTDGAAAGTTFSDINSGLIIKYMINNANAAVLGRAQANLTFVNIHDGDARWETYNGGNISFFNHSGGLLPENDTIIGNSLDHTNTTSAGSRGGSSGCDLAFTEIDTGKETEVGLLTSGGHVNITFTYDTVDDEIQFENAGSTALGTMVALKNKDTDSTYDYRGRTAYGTSFEMYQKDDGDLTIYYPDEAVYAEVLAAASEAVTGTLGTLTPVLESDVSDVSAQNLILVGGPCANGLTAQFTGEGKTFPDCNKNYKAGEAMLKLFANGDKVALVVAGYDVDDTKRAAVALGKGSDLPAKESAKVTGTSLELSEITVV